MSNLPTPHQFLTDFFKDMLNTPDPTNRPALIAGYAKTMEIREEAIRQQACNEVTAEAKKRGRQQIADLADRYKSRADYFRPESEVVLVSSLVWVATLDSGPTSGENTLDE